MLSIDLFIRTFHVGKFLKKNVPNLKLSVAAALPGFLPHTRAAMGLPTSVPFPAKDLFI